MTAHIALESGAAIPNAPLLAGESTPTQYNLVWPDTMPMQGSNNPTTPLDEATLPPDLRMRATAVYHYRNSAGISQTPMACVSSYYNPTTGTTAQNGTYGAGFIFPWSGGATNLPVNPDPSITAAAGSGRSNNGVVYPPPYTTDAGRFTAISTYLTELRAQAKLMFPSGRIVNRPLQQALEKLNTSGTLAVAGAPLSLAENSAIDTAICAIRIVDNTTLLVPLTTLPFPHGAIKEATFLDGRQVKAIDRNPTLYDLELEQRQPLEIRVTDINMRQLAEAALPALTGAPQEYVLPNSGIIYATRDDALLDLSDPSPETELLSPIDFILDPTRRPNGIRLWNGANLARDNAYRAAEKGLILVTNLPAYIKGDFNRHFKAGTTTLTEEFTLHWLTTGATSTTVVQMSTQISTMILLVVQRNLGVMELVLATNGDSQLLFLMLSRPCPTVLWMVSVLKEITTSEIMQAEGLLVMTLTVTVMCWTMRLALATLT